jgi:hypothetical protein
VGEEGGGGGRGWGVLHSKILKDTLLFVRNHHHNHTIVGKTLLFLPYCLRYRICALKFMLGWR